MLLWHDSRPRGRLLGGGEARSRGVGETITVHNPLTFRKRGWRKLVDRIQKPRHVERRQQKRSEWEWFT